MKTRQSPKRGRKRERRTQKESHSTGNVGKRDWPKTSLIRLPFPVTAPARVKEEHQLTATPGQAGRAAQTFLPGTSTSQDDHQVQLLLRQIKASMVRDDSIKAVTMACRVTSRKEMEFVTSPRISNVHMEAANQEHWHCQKREATYKASLGLSSLFRGLPAAPRGNSKLLPLATCRWWRPGLLCYLTDLIPSYAPPHTQNGTSPYLTRSLCTLPPLPGKSL